MSSSKLRVVVFGSSSAKTPRAYLDAAERLGRLLAARGHVCVNGAGRFGCMGALNKGGLDAGGRVEGVIHAMWCPGGKTDELQGGMDALHVADGPTLAERKRLLCADADCYIILPGGPGTLDEGWEVICERQIGLPTGCVPRPVVAVNVDGYWDATYAQLERAARDQILYKPPREVLVLEDTVDAALAYVEAEVARLRAEAGVVAADGDAADGADGKQQAWNVDDNAGTKPAFEWTTDEHRGKEGAATGGDADAGAAAASVASAAAGDGDAAYRRGLLHGLAVGAAAAAVIGVFCLRS